MHVAVERVEQAGWIWLNWLVSRRTLGSAPEASLMKMPQSVESSWIERMRGWTYGDRYGVHRQARESGQEMSDDDAPVGQVILDWTWIRGWACTTIVRNALCA